MKSAGLLVVLSSMSLAFAEETSVRPQVDSVGLFKNGLCVVKCSFMADRAGDYWWAEPPRAVHGTFFVESDGAVAVRSTLRKVEDSDVSNSPTGNLQTDLAGAEVKVTLLSDPGKEATAVTGRVWIMPEVKPQPRIWGSLDGASDRYASAMAGASPITVPTDRRLSRTGERSPYQGVHRPGADRRVEVIQPGGAKKKSEDKPAMIFSVAKPGP
jgi:hypothetical protein